MSTYDIKITKRKIITIIAIAVIIVLPATFNGCTRNASREEQQTAMEVQQALVRAQPMPTDIQASLERHNLIRRSYWINGMRERAMSMPNPIADPPLGYIILFDQGVVVGSFVVEGKVTSLNYSLVPYSEFWEARGDRVNRWIANPGGVYGTNSNGVFWFTPDRKYMEWTGTYLFSDIPFLIESPILNVNVIDESLPSPGDY